MKLHQYFGGFFSFDGFGVAGHRSGILKQFGHKSILT